MGTRKLRGRKKRKKARNKKTFGKALDAELREALGGTGARAAAKSDGELFFVNKAKGIAPIPRRVVVRKLYAEKRAEKLRNPNPNPNLVAPGDQRKVAKLANALEKGVLPSEPQKVKEDYGLVKGLTVIKQQSTELYDPWASNPNINPSRKGLDKESNAWVEEMNVPGMEETKKGRGRKRKLRHAGGERMLPSVPAVKVCHPAGSYNPSFDQHKAGLQQLVTKELEHRSKKSSNVSGLLQAAEERIKESTEAELAQNDIEEVEVEAKEEEEDNEEKANEEEKEDKEGDKMVQRRRDKLTRAERNRQARLREELTHRQERKAKKQFDADLSNAKAISKQVRKEESIRKTRLQKRKELIKKKEQEAEPVVRVNG